MRATHTQIFIAFLFFFFSIMGLYAQTYSSNKSGIPLPKGNSIATLYLDVSKLDVSQIGQLKDAFIEYHEKVSLVEFDQHMEMMKVHYNRFMLEEDIQSLVTKFAVKIRRELYPVSDESLPVKNE